MGGYFARRSRVRRACRAARWLALLIFWPPRSRPHHATGNHRFSHSGGSLCSSARPAWASASARPALCGLHPGYPHGGALLGLLAGFKRGVQALDLGWAALACFSCALRRRPGLRGSRFRAPGRPAPSAGLIQRVSGRSPEWAATGAQRPSGRNIWMYVAVRYTSGILSLVVPAFLIRV